MGITVVLVLSVIIRHMDSLRTILHLKIIPTWQNKMQAIMYEDSIFTPEPHITHMSLLITNLRLFPTPSYWGMTENGDEIWVKFYVDLDAVCDWFSYDVGVEGINNINTLFHLTTFRYENINSMGQQWISKVFSCACAKKC